MQQASVYNLKIVILAGAIALGLMVDHKSTNHADCLGCDQPDTASQVTPSLLVKEPDVVRQYDFQGKDT